MKFIMKIESDNAAFTEGPAGEVARILRRLADRIESGDAAIGGFDAGKLMDINGNAVGSFDYDQCD